MNDKKIRSIHPLMPGRRSRRFTGGAPRCLLYFALIFQACSYSQPKTLTILHTNDMHASYLPHEAFWVRSDQKPMVGGFYELLLASV